MRRDFAFHLSFYLTLALASITLGIAEQPFLNDALLWVVPIPVLLATAFLVEGRWSLSIRAANIVGGVIFIGMLAWVLSRLKSDDPVLAQATMPAALLPYLGPLLMVLMAAKLFRPKHVGDYWGLYAIGLMQVALGCVLAMDLFFGALLMTYIACLLWSLACFHGWRQRTASGDGAVATASPGIERRRRLAWLLPAGQALIWLAIVLTVGFLVFFCTPRSAQMRWDAQTLQPIGTLGVLQTGIGDGVDLNRTGHVEVTNEVVCELTVQNADGSPKTDLPDTQRWRTKTLDYYRNRKWQPHVPQSNGPERGGTDTRPPAAAGSPPPLPELERSGMPEPTVARLGTLPRGPADGDAEGQRSVTRSLPQSGVRIPGPATPAPGAPPGSPRAAGTAIVGIGANAGPPTNLPRGSFRLPDYGPQQTIITYKVYAEKAGGLLLADPVTLRPQLASPARGALQGLAALCRTDATPVGAALAGVAQAFLSSSGESERPVVTLGERRSRALFFESYGTLVPDAGRMLRDEALYQQTIVPAVERDLSAPIPSRGGGAIWYFNIIRQDFSDDLRDWTNELVARLQPISTYGLTADDLEPNVKGSSAATWERIGHALTEFLANSGEYTYSLDIRRRDTHIDPTLDFLKNVKEGHCTRYAAALALMLRSQGVPARLVIGYRGCEPVEDTPGSYVIRQSHAHAWVEIPVHRPGPNGAPVWHWLSLDPTPSTEAATATQFSWTHLWESVKRVTQDTWKYFILDYNADQQIGLTQDLADSLGLGGSLLAAIRSPAFWLSWRPWIILAPFAFIAYRVARRVRRVRERRRQASASRPLLAFQARLVRLLERYCRLRAQPSQTAWEFAAAAEPRLSPLVGDLATLPTRITTLFYRVRFGGQPLSAEEGQRLDKQLDEFDAALRRGVRAAGSLSG